MNLIAMAELIWFAIRVPPQKETIAKKILGDNGVTVFLPIRHKLSRANRFTKRKQAYERPLLVGYLFVAFQGMPAWHLVFRFPRLVQYVLGDKGHPIQISSELIDALKVKARGSDIRALRRAMPQAPRHPIRAGKKVKVKIGPYENFIVRVEKVIGDKARITLRMFGSSRSMAISLDRLEVL